MSTLMPSQLTNMLQLARPLEMQLCKRLYSQLYRKLPQELITPFSNCLVSTFDVVRATLPPVLTSPPPENLGLSPDLCAMLTKLTNELILLLGTLVTGLKFLSQADYVNRLVCGILTAMNNGLYGDPSLDLPGLLHSMHSAFANYVHMPLPRSALTNFPPELFSMLNNPVQHPFPLDLILTCFPRFLSMVTFSNVKMTLTNLIAHEQFQLPLNDISDTQGDHLEGLHTGIQYVYQAREGTEAGPDNCPICLEEMRDGDIVRRLDCLHFFHLQCIDRWLETKTNCPLCRTSINTSHNS